MPALAQPPPSWNERYEISLPPSTLAPTGVDRLADAEVLVVHDDDLFWDGSQWNLVVDPWITWNGRPYDNSGCSPPGEDPNSTLPICDTTPPIHQQPTPGEACTGVLVAPDLVVTAGHCFDSGGAKLPVDCSHRWVIFDYAYLDANHVLEDPPGSGLVPLSAEQLVQCDEVLVDTWEAPATSEEGLLQPPTGAGDWSLWRLNGSAPAGHIPIPLDRLSEAKPGDPALVLHHPARVPLKGEITTIDSSNSTDVDILPLGGTSGSPVIDLLTGKLNGVLATACWQCWGIVQGCGSSPCVDLQYDHPLIGAGGTPANLMALDVPPIGLQLAEQMPQRTVADFYGPPTTPADYPTWTATLSVPLDSFPPSQDFPLAWEAKQDDPGDAWFEVVAGPSSGTLWDDGTEVTVETAPTSLVPNFDPGIYERTFSYFDYHYGTRTAVIHRAYVGVEGFRKWPSADLDGEGPGAPETTTQLYTVANRWIVDQDVTVEARDPAVPGEPWPPWLLLNQGTSPVTLDLSPAGVGFPGFVSLSFDASGLDPDVYTAALSFESDDSGTPAYREELGVRLDACRRITQDLLVLPEIEILPGGAPYERTLAVGTYPQTSIKDVDVALVTSLPQISGQGSFIVTLEGPEVDPITLKNEFTTMPQRGIWDDETDEPAELLSEFDNSNSTGPWILRITNTGNATLSGELERFEIRLHHHSQPPCVP